VIFAAADCERIPALRLAPLLKRRQAQAGERYRDELARPGFDYQPGDSKLTWLRRNGGAPGPVDPRKLPYYLLIVGDPQQIPFSFQDQLDLAHAVGRIHFDTLAEYASYAQSVAAAEETTRPLTLPRQAAFFAAVNGADPATQLSAGQLVAPLAQAFAARLQGWQVSHWEQAAATKARLAALLGGDSTPAFLFSAMHGLGLEPSGHLRQRTEQGALVCSDWRGQGAPEANHCLAAADIGDDARLAGLIAFFFACYGAGTPQCDDFTIATRQELEGVQLGGLETLDPIRIAPAPFVARLPQRLLGHPRGGALAVVGHIDRAWGSAFLWEGVQQSATFESALTRLFGGDRLGVVVEDFSDRDAELSAEVAAAHLDAQSAPVRAARRAGAAVDRQQRRPEHDHPGRPGGAAGSAGGRPGRPWLVAGRDRYDFVGGG